MSKAFTSESDEEEEFHRPPSLPPGVRNYMTREGYERMTSEHAQLTSERSGLSPAEWLQQRRLKWLDQRLAFLTERLDAAQVIEASAGPPDHVRFGAEVTLQAEGGPTQRWTIVGIDEMDLDQGKLSWQSPLANALFEKAVGDVITINRQPLTIIKII